MTSWRSVHSQVPRSRCCWVVRPHLPVSCETRYPRRVAVPAREALILQSDRLSNLGQVPGRSSYRSLRGNGRVSCPTELREYPRALVSVDIACFDGQGCFKRRVSGTSAYRCVPPYARQAPSAMIRSPENTIWPSRRRTLDGHPRQHERRCISYFVTLRKRNDERHLTTSTGRSPPDFGTNSWMRRTVLVDSKHRIREHCWSRRLTDAPTLQAFSTGSCHANGRVEDVIRYESLSARPPSIRP